MGLAASQARFLCITARKAECEYKSTEIAQQKLEITNQLSDISAEYANAMNATKLVWDNEAAAYQYGLTYGLLMTPSAANNFNPYMVTTKSGAIVLNSEYAAAAKAAGISKAGGVPSQDQRDKFIAALVPGGIITQQTANAIMVKDYIAETDGNGEITFTEPATRSGSVLWNPDAGMGGVIMDKESIDVMDLSALIMSESIGKKKIDWAQLFVPPGQITQNEYDNEIENFDKQIKEKQNALHAASDQSVKDSLQQEIDDLIKQRDDYKNANQGKVWTFDSANPFADKFQTGEMKIKGGGNYYTVVQNGVINSHEEELKDMTIGDILSNNIVLMTETGDLKAFSEQLITLMESIAKIFGWGEGIGVGLNVDDASNEALDYALKMIKRKFLNPSNKVNIGSNCNDSALTDNSAYQNAANYNCLGSDSSNKYAGVSLTNMLASFLTYYDNYLNGINSNFVVGKSVDTSQYVTQSQDYVYVGQTQDEEITMDKKVADFYDQIYNNICEYGWREDDTLEDSEYLESVLKDGRYSLASLNNDGYYYQTRYNETGYIIEMTDEDAIAIAEAEYTQKKAQLTYKEDSLDMKFKKLDAEISMLTTEYESVKTLITKSIEKTFSMFSN